MTNRLRAYLDRQQPRPRPEPANPPDRTWEFDILGTLWRFDLWADPEGEYEPGELAPASARFVAGLGWVTIWQFPIA